MYKFVSPYLIEKERDRDKPLIIYAEGTRDKLKNIHALNNNYFIVYNLQLLVENLLVNPIC